jgi:threonine aldolase
MSIELFMHTIDLRSDTVSHPTPEMRAAMASAPLGDDVYGEDPTVNALEAQAAEVLNKEAALFVSSGTQSNLIAVLTHCGRGDELIVGKQAHIFKYESGGSAALAGAHAYTVEVAPDGTLPLDALRQAIRPDNIHYPRTRLICLENTQGTLGGIPITASYTDAVGELAHSVGAALHVDGARLFNAATALGGHAVAATARALVAAADSVSICLSKGLCAPVGSLLLGRADFIAQARRYRKVLGGGMRQAGVLAAAGQISLHTMIHRLADDHANARRLAQGLAALPHVVLDVARVQTNMVFFDLAPSAPISADALATALAARGILLRPLYGATFRAVLHYWITAEHVDLVVNSIAAAVHGEGLTSQGMTNQGVR